MPFCENCGKAISLDDGEQVGCIIVGNILKWLCLECYSQGVER